MRRRRAIIRLRRRCAGLVPPSTSTATIHPMRSLQCCRTRCDRAHRPGKSAERSQGNIRSRCQFPRRYRQSRPRHRVAQKPNGTISAADDRHLQHGSLDQRTPADERLSLVFAPGEETHPFMNYEYAVVSTQQPDPETAAAIRHFLLWSRSRLMAAMHRNISTPCGSFRWLISFGLRAKSNPPNPFKDPDQRCDASRPRARQLRAPSRRASWLTELVSRPLRRRAGEAGP